MNNENQCCKDLIEIFHVEIQTPISIRVETEKQTSTYYFPQRFNDENIHVEAKEHFPRDSLAEF